MNRLASGGGRWCAAALFILVSARDAGAAETLNVPLPEPRPGTEVFTPPPLPEPRPLLPARGAEDGLAAPAPTAAPEVAAAPEPSACLATLAGSGVRFSRPPAQAFSDECRPEDAVIVEAVGASTPVGVKPAVTVTCPVALALASWVAETVKPAADEIGGGLEIQAGSGHDCRTRNRQEGAPMSEHAKANAVDVMGFRIGERVVRVATDWGQETPAGLFLTKVHAGACRQFTTVLGPNADAAHADHFHLDLKTRGKSLPRLCQ